MNVYLLAIMLLLAGVSVGALSIVLLRAWVNFLKRSYRRTTNHGQVADKHRTHLVAKSLIADGIALGFIGGIAGFVGIIHGWCYISAYLCGSWTFGYASVGMGAWATILHFWGPLFSGEGTAGKRKSDR